MSRKSCTFLRVLALALALVGASVTAAVAASPAAIAERGALLVREERYPEAERVLRHALKIDPAQPEAIYYLGRLYLETERIPEAIRYYESMVAKHPRSSRVRQGLGEAYAVEALRASVFRQIGLARDSRKALETAVVLDPGNIEARISLFEFYRHAPVAGRRGPGASPRSAPGDRAAEPVAGARAPGQPAQGPGAGA